MFGHTFTTRSDAATASYKYLTALTAMVSFIHKLSALRTSLQLVGGHSTAELFMSLLLFSFCRYFA